MSLKAAVRGREASGRAMLGRGTASFLPSAVGLILALNGLSALGLTPKQISTETVPAHQAQGGPQSSQNEATWAKSSTRHSRP